jgi:hypothetical protein
VLCFVLCCVVWCGVTPCRVLCELSVCRTQSRRAALCCVQHPAVCGAGERGLPRSSAPQACVRGSQRVHGWAALQSVSGHARCACVLTTCTHTKPSSFCGALGVCCASFHVGLSVCGVGLSVVVALQSAHGSCMCTQPCACTDTHACRMHRPCPRQLTFQALEEPGCF